MPCSPYASRVPLDISLRVLLMHLALPKETRAMGCFVETFASKWTERYPRLVATDQSYIVVLSMIVLHMDHFNPSNMKKMRGKDYLRNGRRDGGFAGCRYFYDSITFTRHIFVEDAVDVHGQRSLKPAPDICPSGIFVSPAASVSSGGRRGKKFDNSTQHTVSAKGWKFAFTVNLSLAPAMEDQDIPDAIRLQIFKSGDYTILNLVFEFTTANLVTNSVASVTPGLTDTYGQTQLAKMRQDWSRTQS
ncbi:hypothetical protein CALVIDRAFT_568352 [Calocera viscosa TUFC12733]|uniref:SEC7 domain-containing protein n=1 Tax=Calocera viscosa (strain TUFC12733) TaxID=1330018 RepID=A0A167H7B1_CALVF|nr:hypothetical protein CALVIDRAFT_568352 [Calocera viscosa TUFC12733]